MPSETPMEWAERIWADAHCADDTHRAEVAARVKAEVVADLAATKRKADERDEAVELLEVITGGVERWNAAVSEIIDTSKMPKWDGLQASHAFLAKIGGQQ